MSQKTPSPRVSVETLRRRLGQRSSARIHESSVAQAAVALVLVPSSDDLEALFIRRAEVVGDPWSGHIALPGGRRDQSDGDLLHTAVRETREETGIALAPEACLGELDEFMPRSPHLPRIVVRPFVFALADRPEITPSSEVDNYVWLKLGDLRRARTTVDLEIQGSLWKVDAYVIGPVTIWGLTERIINPFLQLAVQL